MSMAVMANNTIVEMKTSMGNIEIELFNDKAPISAKNFEDYTKAKFYNGTIFHRVIPGFNLPHSATSQFFINVVDNNFLDRSTNNAGYAVFGQVTKGMDVVDKITKVPTGRAGPHQDVPKQPVKILSVNIKAAAVQK